jgi:hypothetical protein
MARNLLHEAVRQALLYDGWAITHDPYEMRPYNPNWEMDLGAERLIGAEREAEKIAVEVKSFRASSFSNEFHTVLGQYLNYRSGLKRIEADRMLYLAVPLEIYDVEFRRAGILNSVEDYDVDLVIFDPITPTILLWNP